MGYAVVINSLTLSGCTPQVYFPVQQIHSEFGQFSRTAVLHVYTQHSRLFQTWHLHMNMSFCDGHTRRKKKAEGARINN